MGRYRRRRRVKPTWEMLYIKDAATCFLCFGHVLPEDASVEHVIPRSKGGPDNLQNTVLAHRECNGAKKDDYPDEDLLLRLWERNGWNYHAFAEACPDVGEVIDAITRNSQIQAR